MELRINGGMVQVPDSISTISDLIEYFNLENRVVIIEQNHVILEKQDHKDTKINELDSIEIVQFVGGG
jgi:sulfur carrier protein